MFPSAYNFLKKANIDFTKEKIPVTPAAHYHMGGVLVDENGKSSIKGLWACGEVSSTGATERIDWLQILCLRPLFLEKE